MRSIITSNSNTKHLENILNICALESIGFGKRHGYVGWPILTLNNIPANGEKYEKKPA